MINRRLRMTLEFDVTVDEKIGELWNGDWMTPADESQYRSHEQALLDAMIADPEVLRRWIRGAVVSHMDGSIDSELGKALGISGDEESLLIKDRIRTLSGGHGDFWESLEADGMVSENDADVGFALKVSLADARLEELQPTLVGIS